MNEVRKKTVVAIVLLTLIGSIAWSYVALQASSSPSHVSEASITLHTPYAITSQKELSIYPKGTVFEPGRLAYFYATEPLLSLTPQVRLNEMDEIDRVSGYLITTVILQTTNDQGEVYWSQPLDQFRRKSDVTASGINEAPVVIKPAGLFEEITAINDELDIQTGNYQIVLQNELHMTCMRNGERVNQVIRQLVPISLFQNYFSIQLANEEEETRNLYFSLDQTDSSIPIYIVVPFTLVGTSVLLLLYLLMKKRSKQATYKEWITEGVIGEHGKTKIRIHSLEGLVDVAIDHHRRIIYDFDQHIYVVFVDDLMYYYKK